MAAASTQSNRKSHLLAIDPITTGTNIPAPLSTPPKSPIEPPTPGRGPLNSHPATYFEQERKEEPKSGVMSSPERADSFRTPTSPASAARYSSSPTQAQNKPKGVRRLLSLTNLRSSFSSSRTSLSLPRQSNDTYPTTGSKRPSSPSLASTNGSSVPSSARPQLRPKKSGGNWFKRKSGLFVMDEETVPTNGGDWSESANGDVHENGRPESKRLKESSPPPFLPELGILRGGKFSDGDLGWDEQAFKR